MSEHGADCVLNAIGLAKRAGKIISGSERVREAIRERKALMVIAARDISQNSRKRLVNSCAFYNVELTEYSLMDELSHALGEKKPVACAAVTDANFKTLIKKQLSGTTEND